MITAQDIREKTFEKSRLNGYDMASVDDYLEELAEEITAAQKENATLKAKMKVLVEKIEDYRANETALNNAVLSAQKLAVQIESEARARADAMVADADKQAKARIGSIEDDVAFAEKRLADAKAASRKFFDGMRAMCHAQLKNIDNISNSFLPPEEAAPAPAPAPAPAARPSVEEFAGSIEKAASKLTEEPRIKVDFDDDDVKTAPAGRNASLFEDTQPFNF